MVWPDIANACRTPYCPKTIRTTLAAVKGLKATTVVSAFTMGICPVPG